MQELLKKPSRLEKLERDLYSKNVPEHFSERHALHEKNYSLKNDWVEKQNLSNENEPQREPRKFNFFSFMLSLAILFFIGAASYAGYVFYKGKTTISADAVDIKVLGPVYIGGGEELDLELIIQNNNPTELQTVDLVVEFPVGTKSAEDLITDLKRERIRLENIPPNSALRQPIKASLFGEEGKEQLIQFAVEYRVENSDAIFSKNKDYQIMLGASPIRLIVDAKNTVSSGQEYVLKYKIESNSNNVLNNVALQVTYPFGFKFVQADVKPTENNNYWLFDTLDPKESKEVTITGIMEGQNLDQRTFRFDAGLAKDDDEKQIGAIFNSVLHELAVDRPFLDLSLEVNGKTSPVIVTESGKDLNMNLRVANNTNYPITDLRLVVSFSGSLIDRKSIQNNSGFFNSVDNTIVFNSETYPALARLEPRDDINLTFTADTFSVVDGKTGGINPEARLKISATGDRVSEDSSENVITATNDQVIKFLTEVPLSTETLYSTGPIKNSGPIPPKVDSLTTYTIRLAVSNSSSDLKNAKIIGYLPSYVSWKNQISPTDQRVTFDPNTRKLIWDIGDVKSKVGYTSPIKELYFQVELLASLSQLNQDVDLLNEPEFTAVDSFTNTSIEKTMKNATTRIIDVGKDGNFSRVTE